VSFHDKEGGYSNFDEFRIPYFDGNLDFESHLLWINKVDKLFYIEYIPMEGYVEFVAYKLIGRTTAWWNHLKNVRMYQGKPLIRTWRCMKRLLQARFLALEEEEMKIRPRPFMRSYRSNETVKPQ